MPTISLFNTDSNRKSTRAFYRSSKPAANKNIILKLEFYDLDIAGEASIEINGTRLAPIITNNRGANDTKWVSMNIITPGNLWKGGKDKDLVTFIRHKSQGYQVRWSGSGTNDTSKAPTHKAVSSSGGSTPTPTPTPAPSGGLKITQKMLADATSKPHEVFLKTVPSSFSFYHTPNPYDGDQYYKANYDFVDSVPGRKNNVVYTHLNDWNKLYHYGSKDVGSAVMRLNPVNMAVRNRKTGKWFVRGQYVQRNGFVSQLNAVDKVQHGGAVKSFGSKENGYGLVGYKYGNWAASSPNYSVHGWSAERFPYSSADIDVVIWWMTAQVVSHNGSNLGAWADSLYSMAVGGDVFNAAEGKYRRGFQGRQLKLTRKPRLIFHTNASGAKWQQLKNQGGIPNAIPLA